jgi:hypothetical protein
VVERFASDRLQQRQGDRLQAALFLPANYQEGKSYLTIVYIYERLSQGLNRYSARRRVGSTRRSTPATATRC